MGALNRDARGEARSRCPQPRLIGLSGSEAHDVTTQLRRGLRIVGKRGRVALPPRGNPTEAFLRSSRLKGMPDPIGGI